MMKLTGQSILILGAGKIGSTIADMLAELHSATVTLADMQPPPPVAIPRSARYSWTYRTMQRWPAFCSSTLWSSTPCRFSAPHAWPRPPHSMACTIST